MNIVRDVSPGEFKELFVGEAGNGTPITVLGHLTPLYVQPWSFRPLDQRVVGGYDSHCVRRILEAPGAHEDAVGR